MNALNSPTLQNSNSARDLTTRDFSKHLGSVASLGGLNVAFAHVKVRIETIEPEKNGTMETRLVVYKQPKGDRYTVAARFITPEQAMSDPELQQAYQMFVQYDDVPTQGTPLHELPGVSQSQIGLITLNGLRSVEDLAEIPDDVTNQMGLEVMAAKKLAVKWMAARAGNENLISTAELEAKHEIFAKSQRERLDALEKQNIELAAQNKALRSVSAGAAPQAGTSVHMPGVSTAASEGGVMAVDSGVPDFDVDDGFLDDSLATTSGDDDLGGNDLDPNPLA